MIDRNAMKF
jgi:hypothetical protein